MKRIFQLFLLTAVCLISGCDNGSSSTAMQHQPDSTEEQKATAEYKKITAEEARAMMDDGDEYILLDVRTEDEFLESRMDGALLIPDTEIKDRAPGELPNKDTRILIYCRSGKRSALAAKDLIEMGYTDVYDFGGIIDWLYETISG